MDVVVTTNNELPDVKAKAGTLDCNHPSTNFVVTTENNGLTYQWTGPNGFSSSEKEPLISVAGIYQLVATGTGGCSVTETVEVEENIALPQVAISGDIITCANPSVELKGLSNDEIIQFSWTGVNGLISNEPNIEVNQAGLYELRLSLIHI